MKTKWLWVICLTIFVCYAQFAFAFDSGSTGADGDFAPTTNTALQIPESGIFNYGSVTIPSGVMITFKKNSKNTPVTILATGDVVINGTISVNGSDGNYIVGSVGGPGGFDGGVGGVTAQTGRRGEGPGGGTGGTGRSDSYYCAGGGGGGGYGANGSAGTTACSAYPGGAGGTAYGNERILPLIGGSGGGGGGGSNLYNARGGGGGGGSIVIASSGTITISGSITANGGNGTSGDNSYPGGSGGGSGGSIRLIANTIAGNGTLSATAGSGGGSSWAPGGSGGLGRIRLEASNMLRTSATNPPFSMGYPYAVVPQNMPLLAITSVGGVNVPEAPKGSFGLPDVMLPYNTTNPVTAVVTGANIPVGTTVTVKAIPSVGTSVSASSALSGTDASSTASVQLNISKAYPSLITASVTFQLASLGIGPIYAEGERVDKIRVETAIGKGSTVIYITESGREIPIKQKET